MMFLGMWDGIGISALFVTALRVGASNKLATIIAEINIQTVPPGHLGPTNDSFV
jgi:hypothetical protein